MVRKFLKNQKGLTLVELLAVIVILGVIAAIAVPSIGNIIQKSKEDGVKADAIMYLNAAKLYYLENSESIEEDTSLSTTDLEDYIEDTGGHFDGISDFGITFDNGTPQLTATDVPAGNINLSFSNATIADINADTSGDGTTSIPNNP